MILLTKLRRAVESAAARFEPGVLGVTTAEAAVAEWAAIEKVAVAAKLRAAARCEDIGLDAEMAVANGSGVTTRQARRQTRLRRKLAGKKATQAAFDTGRLSLTEADAIAETVDVAPGAEESLLALAATGSATDLLAECERVRRDALDADDTLADKQKAAREFRHWTDSLGMTCIAGRFEPVAGAKLLADMERRASRLFRKQSAAKAGIDTVEQRMADALIEIVDSSDPAGSKRARGPRTKVQLLVTKAAVERGYLQPGEKCETADGKPVPLRAVDVALLDPDTEVQEAEFDETDVRAIRTYKRYRPARLQDGIDARGRVCSVPGCGRTRGLQADHRNEMQDGGATCATNLDWLCQYHHDLKTRGLYQLVRDQDGTRRWVSTRGPPVAATK